VAAAGRLGAAGRARPGPRADQPRGIVRVKRRLGATQLRTDGRNTLAIAEWSLAAGDGGIGQVSLVPYEIQRGGILVQTVASPG
jgi:hypothetical protein